MDNNTQNNRRDSGLLTGDVRAWNYMFNESIFSDLPEEPSSNTQPAKPTVEDSETSTVTLPKTSLPYFGDNRRRILFVSDEVEAANLAQGLQPSSMEAYLKILSALKLTSEDIALVNFPRVREGETWNNAESLKQQVIQQFRPKKIILLGVPPEDFGFTAFELPLHTVKIVQETSWLFTFSFGYMGDDAEKKRAFWQAVKKLF